MFELGGFNSDTIPLGILHEQLVSLVKAIFGNQPPGRLWDYPPNKIDETDLTTRLSARDFYRVIVDESVARINYCITHRNRD